MWVQEEPRNQGPWPHVGVRLKALLAKMQPKMCLTFTGRKESAVPAVGIAKIAQREKAEVLKKALAME